MIENLIPFLGKKDQSLLNNYIENLINNEGNLDKLTEFKINLILKLFENFINKISELNKNNYKINCNNIIENFIDNKKECLSQYFTFDKYLNQNNLVKKEVISFDNIIYKISKF